MRAPKRKRPRVRAQLPPGAQKDLQVVAIRASYIGSPEHKDHLSLAGVARPRADASICDRKFARDFKIVADWLRNAILKGQVSEYWEGEFPRYVWFRDGDTVYEARLVNREAGWYRGYPLEPTEWPEGI